MKRKALIGLIMMTVLAGGAFAQNCDYIVGAKYNWSEEIMQALPIAKKDYYCRMSCNTFFVTDQVPEGATVMNINVIKSLKSGKNLTSSFIVDLSVLSIYEYDFSNYQPLHGNAVYFETPASEHRYLGVRPYGEVMNMTGDIDPRLDDRGPSRTSNR